MPAPSEVAAPGRVVGAILVGGQARRMGGGDKGLLPLGGNRILNWVIARLEPQVDALVLSGKGDLSRFSGFGLPLVADREPGLHGPLAGILASLEWAVGQAPPIDWVLTVPGDTPFLPVDLRRRLQLAAGSGVACAASAGRSHWPVALWPLRLRATLLTSGLRSVGDFARSQGCSLVSWPTKPVDPFHNINTPDDLAAAEGFVAAASTRPACRPLA